MVQLVQRRQKTFSRRSHIVPKVLTYSAPVRAIRRASSRFFVIGFVFVLLLFLRYIFYSTIFSSDYTIQSVRYDSGSVSIFDEPVLYSTITKALQGKNYYLMRYFGKGKVFDTVRSEFPMVAHMDVFLLEKHTAAVSLRFHDPLMIVGVVDKKYAVYDAYTIIPLYPQNTLGDSVYQLSLAGYLSGLDSLDGLFFRLSPQVLIDQLHIFDDYFRKPYQVLYFPGAEKTQITAADGKILYFNNLGDIVAQLRKIDLLKQYYDDFEMLWQFDLGGLDPYTVIVKK